MYSHAIFTSKIEELKEFIKNNGLPDSSNHKKKKINKRLYCFINDNEKLTKDNNAKKYRNWMIFLEKNYDLFDHSSGCYQKTSENLWLYLLNKCFFLNERPEDPDSPLYKWFHFNNKNLNNCKKNSGKEWYPIRDQKYKEYFKNLLKENPQLAFN